MTGARLEASGESGRIAAIDVLRGIAIVLVVLCHVSWRMVTPASAAAAGGGVIAGAHFLSNLGVPLFLAISAYSLAWRRGEPFGGVRPFLAFLGARSARLLPAYVLWSLASLAARDPSLLASVRGVAHALVVGTADVQFYFVPMLLELSIAWVLLRPVLASRTRTGALASLVAGAWIADLAWRSVLHPPWTSLVYYAVAVAAGAGFHEWYAARGVSARRQLATTTDAPAALVATALLVPAAAALWSTAELFVAQAPLHSTKGALYVLAMGSARLQVVFTTCAIVALLLVAGTLARTRAGAVLASLGRASYGIFLIHLLVASSLVYRFFPIDRAAQAGAIAAAAVLAAVCVATLAASFAVVRLLERTPRLRWTVGAA